MKQFVIYVVIFGFSLKVYSEPLKLTSKEQEIFEKILVAEKEKDFSKAKRYAESLHRSNPENPYFQAKLASTLRKLEKTDKALLILNEYLSGIKSYSDDDAIAHFELVSCLLELKRKKEADQILFKMKNRAKSYLIRSKVEENIADSDNLPEFTIMKCEELIKKYSTALDLVSHFINKEMKDNYGYKTNEDAEAIKKRIKNKISKLKKIIYEMSVGEAYILYVKAQELRFKEKFLESGKAYNQIINLYPDTIYSDAAKFYLVICYYETKEFKKASILTSSLLENDHSLYVPQLLYYLGRMSLEQKLNFEEADKYFESLQKLITKLRESDPVRKKFKTINDLPGMTSKAIEVSKPSPFRYTNENRWGRVTRISEKPGQVVNRISCTWLIDDLEEKCAMFQGFLCIVKDEKEVALTHFAKVPKLNPRVLEMQKLGEANTYLRLKFGAENGYLVAYPEELKKYSGKTRAYILLIDFYYVSEQFSLSEKLCRELLSGTHGKFSSTQKDYIYFALGNSIYRGKWKAGGSSPKAAFKEIQRVLEKKDNTYTERRAALACFNLSRKVADKEIRELGEKYINSLLNSSLKDDFYYKSAANYGLDLLYQNKIDQAKIIFEKIPDDHELKEYADFVIQKFTEALKEKGP